jgi:hypothetical protein
MSLRKHLAQYFLLFPEKEAKSVVPLRGSIFEVLKKGVPTPNSAKPTLGVWGLAPKKNPIGLIILFLQQIK